VRLKLATSAPPFVVGMVAPINQFFSLCSTTARAQMIEAIQTIANTKDGEVDGRAAAVNDRGFRSIPSFKMFHRFPLPL
jgi:hypothetical protein